MANVGGEGRWHNFYQMHYNPLRREDERTMAMSKDEPWSSASAPPPDLHIRIHGTSFHVNKRCVASRSAKLARILESNSHVDNLTASSFADDVPGDAHAFALVVRFCYGHDLDLTADTVIPVACVSSCLEMTEEHSPNNLLDHAIAFIAARVLPCWNETIKAFKTVTQQMLPHAQHLGIVPACLQSIAEKAAADPTVVSDPGAMMPKPGARRKLFAVDDVDRHPPVEDLTSLSLPLYTLVISALSSYPAVLPPDHLALCVYHYATRWLDQSILMGAAPPDGVAVKVPVVRDGVSQREMIETLEELMPNIRGAIHVKCLFQLLRSAMFLQASQKCRSGLEARIGKQLPEAWIEDLCIPSYGYASETKYDTKCVVRILGHFSSSSLPELEAVSDLLEDFLAEVAADGNLRGEEFVAMLGVLVAVLEPIKHRSHDGVYRAVDAFLDAHRFLTEKEREHVCRCLDLRRLSVDASEHAATSQRLPLRAIAQLLFIGQLRIRQTFGELTKGEHAVGEDEMAKVSMEMDERVRELESECRLMREGIDGCVCGRRGKKDGWKLWKEVRNLFGCKSRKRSAVVECNCQLKKTKQVHSTMK